jgi:hypothetical protein
MGPTEPSGDSEREEGTRQIAEVGRQAAEERRDAAEELRQTREELRQAAEGARLVAERLRVAEETLRRTEEVKRVAAELLRTSSRGEPGGRRGDPGSGRNRAPGRRGVPPSRRGFAACGRGGAPDAARNPAGDPRLSGVRHPPATRQCALNSTPRCVRRVYSKKDSGTPEPGRRKAGPIRCTTSPMASANRPAIQTRSENGTEGTRGRARPDPGTAPQTPSVHLAHPWRSSRSWSRFNGATAFPPWKRRRRSASRGRRHAILLSGSGPREVAPFSTTVGGRAIAVPTAARPGEPRRKG